MKHTKAKFWNGWVISAFVAILFLGLIFPALWILDVIGIVMLANGKEA